MGEREEEEGVEETPAGVGEGTGKRLEKNRARTDVDETCHISKQDRVETHAKASVTQHLRRGLRLPMARSGRTPKPAASRRRGGARSPAPAAQRRPGLTPRPGEVGLPSAGCWPGPKQPCSLCGPGRERRVAQLSQI